MARLYMITLLLLALFWRGEGLTLKCTCDNVMSFYLDGVKYAAPNQGNWAVVDTLNVPDNIDVLAVYCYNSGGPGMIIASLSDGRVTNTAEWKCSNSGPSGWNTANFDDSSWPAARSFGKQGGYGIPWPQVSGINSAADFIWTYGGTISEPTDRHVYCRTAVRVHGGWSAWSAWSTCSSCDSNYDGTQSATRLCNNPTPNHNGRPCSGISSTSQACKCPKHGQWNAWSNWATCSHTCGTGSQSRSRTCDPPLYGGNDCTGSSQQTQSCATWGCPAWGAWGAYGSCVCPGDYKQRSRTCVDPAPLYNNNAGCPGDATSQTACNCPIDGVMQPWGAWGTCSALCNTGSQSRSRVCTPPQYGGKDCVGALTESQNCNTHGCPQWNAWGSYGSCVCPPNTYSGSKTRTRTCDKVSNLNLHTCSGDSSESQNCNCPRDGNWGSWSAYSTCTLTCGNGTHTRYRNCDNPAPAYGGNDCVGEGNQTEQCNTFECPIHGNWSEWINSDCDCSLDAFTGSQYQYRLCNNPTPQYNGDNCTGDSRQSLPSCDCLQSISTSQYFNKKSDTKCVEAYEEKNSDNLDSCLLACLTDTSCVGVVFLQTDSQPCRLMAACTETSTTDGSVYLDKDEEAVQQSGFGAQGQEADSAANTGDNTTTLAGALGGAAVAGIVATGIGIGVARRRSKKKEEEEKELKKGSKEADDMKVVDVEEGNTVSANDFNEETW